MRVRHTPLHARARPFQPKPPVSLLQAAPNLAPTANTCQLPATECSLVCARVRIRVPCTVAYRRRGGEHSARVGGGQGMVGRESREQLQQDQWQAPAQRAQENTLLERFPFQCMRVFCGPCERTLGATRGGAALEETPLAPGFEAVAPSLAAPPAAGCCAVGHVPPSGAVGRYGFGISHSALALTSTSSGTCFACHGIRVWHSPTSPWCAQPCDRCRTESHRRRSAAGSSNEHPHARSSLRRALSIH
jgi:hypothetical protein